MSTMSLKKIESAVLKLRRRERALLAEKLLRSLDDLSDEEIEHRWIEEAERRARDPASRDHPGEQVLKDARARLR